MKGTVVYVCRLSVCVYVGFISYIFTCIYLIMVLFGWLSVVYSALKNNVLEKIMKLSDCQTVIPEGTI